MAVPPLLDRPAGPGTEERLESVFFEFEMLEEMGLEIGEVPDQFETGDAGGIAGDTIGGLDDPLGNVMDDDVIPLQLVDDGIERWIVLAHHRKESLIFQGMMAVDEAAVVPAAEAELPERAVGFQGADFGDDRGGIKT